MTDPAAPAPAPSASHMLAAQTEFATPRALSAHLRNLRTVGMRPRFMVCVHGPDDCWTVPVTQDAGLALLKEAGGQLIATAYNDLGSDTIYIGRNYGAPR